MKRLYFIALTMFLSFTLVTAQEVGIIMGSARDYLRGGNVEEALIKLKNMGIKYVEGAGARNISKTQYKALLDKHGFDVIAMGVTFEKLENADSVKTLIDNIKFYNAEYATCYWIPHKGDDFTFEDMKKGVEVFNRAGKQFAEAGIQFLYHAHGYEFRPYDGPGTMFDYMMEHLDPKYANLELDVFWMRNPGQNPAAIIRKYPGRIPITHLKDRMHGSVNNQNGRQDKQRNVVLGDGDVNIAEVMKASKEMGVKYHFIEDESTRSGVQLPLHLKYLRGLDLDRTSLEYTVEALHKALLDVDSIALTNLTTEELTYGHSSGLNENKEAFMTALLTGKSNYKKITTSNQEITIKGDVAWVRNNMDVENLSNGAPNFLKLKILYVWIKEAGYWKLFSRQAVRLPNP
jgi:sugar phosphate isomerase/epimerase/ketosteroid isomerase-like protein